MKKTLQESQMLLCLIDLTWSFSVTDRFLHDILNSTAHPSFYLVKWKSTPPPPPPATGKNQRWEWQIMKMSKCWFGDFVNLKVWKEYWIFQINLRDFFHYDDFSAKFPNPPPTPPPLLKNMIRLIYFRVHWKWLQRNDLRYWYFKT